MTAPESRDAQSGVAEVLRRVSGEHEYALGVGRGGICACGFVPMSDPGSLRPQQEYHRAHVAAMQATALGPALAAERAKVVEAVAREWQFGGWTILTAPPPASAIPALALGQRVTDWLRERADREQP